MDRHVDPLCQIVNEDANKSFTSEYFSKSINSKSINSLGAKDATQYNELKRRNEAESSLNRIEEKRKKSHGCTETDISPTFIEEEFQCNTQNETSQVSCGLERLTAGFYDVPCQDLAKSLLGKVLVRQLENGMILRGRIVETECYLGGEDKASHSYNGKITPRNKPMYMKCGTIYVYLTYGMYYCFNISSRGAGAAVLLRALEPLEGLNYMQQQRILQRKGSKKKDDVSLSPTKISISTATQSKQRLHKEHELCNGPAKLCTCFGINIIHCNMQDLCVWNGMWIESDDVSEKIKPHHIIASTRIGIDSAGIEWASKPLRFYLFGYKSVSRVDKTREKELCEVYNVVS